MAVSGSSPVAQSHTQSPITGTGIRARFDIYAARKFQLGKFAHAMLSLTLVFSLTFAPAIPAFAQGKLVGEGTRQVKPPVGSPNGVLTAGLRGGEEDGGGCNVPTDASHSPLFGAKSFTQHMLRFEEFGNAPLESNASNTGYGDPYNPEAGCAQDSDRNLPGYCSSLPQPSWAGESKGGKPTDKSQTRRSIQRSANPCFPTPRYTQTRTTRIPGKRPSLLSTPDPCSP
jgi:hypothetical protein